MPSIRKAVLRAVASRLETAPITSALPEGALSTKLIGTHSGRFHCDEALACGLLLHTVQFSSSAILRTRVPDLLARADVVVDVGGVYDHSAARYDHHQATFSTMMETPRAKYTTTKLSSAGLIYLHYGKALIADFCAKFAPETTADVDMLYDKMYKEFVEHVDAIDNGVEQIEGGGEKRYHIPNTLASRVDVLGPRWNEEVTDDSTNIAFREAMILATSEFYERLEYLCMSWLPARRHVLEAFENAQKSENPQILILTTGGVPWKEHLFDIERENGVFGKSLYCVFPERTGEWKVIAVPEKIGGFSNRLPLPWKGLRDGELDAASSVDGCIFVHASGFIGGNKTFEGVMAMAKKSIAMGKQ